MTNKKETKKRSLDQKMNDLLAFNNEKEKQEFDSIILHLETMGKIQELLDSKEKNRQWLAEKLKMSKSFVSQLFSGDKLLNFKLLARMEKIFNTKIQISFKTNSNYRIDAVTRVFDLSNAHPAILPGQSFRSVNPSNEPVDIPFDDTYELDIDSVSIPS